MERGTVRVKCLAQEHNTMSPARALTQTARSGDERTYHEATAPPTKRLKLKLKVFLAGHTVSMVTYCATKMTNMFINDWKIF